MCVCVCVKLSLLVNVNNGQHFAHGRMAQNNWSCFKTSAVPFNWLVFARVCWPVWVFQDCLSVYFNVFLTTFEKVQKCTGFLKLRVF